MLRLAQLLRYFGPRWLVFRVRYALRLRLGLIRRRLPAVPWQDRPLAEFLSDLSLSDAERYLIYRRSAAPSFFFHPAQRQHFAALLAAWEPSVSSPMVLAEELAGGKLRYFEHTVADTGYPPDWHTNPFTGQRIPADRHWSEVGDFGHGDIKVIWEPSRFAFVYTLVRAYWRTGDERYAGMFWELVEDWRRHNPPQSGPNWKCGQEATFRVMAWCFGLYGFLEARATTPLRVQALSQMIAVSGERIEANLDYALSQRNNHGISEGLGLWTIGTLFPELRRAEAWRIQGREVLESLGRELIYDDGAFSQHSLNYHRVMLHDYLWVLHLAEIQQQPFSNELKRRVSKAGALLYQLQDEVSGHVPNYGQNDGALVLPLSTCDYRDYRPVVQATYFMSHGTRCYESGPWDEDLLWLYGPEALDTPVDLPRQVDLAAGVGGYYTLRSQSGFAFVRCANFCDRPGQADMLHLDLWWRGQNIALDAGTFSYNAPAPWNNALAHTEYHNTVTIDGLDQMDQFSRFLWLPWLHSTARRVQQSTGGFLGYWEGAHDGYRRLDHGVLHRRGLLRLGEHWLVLDDLVSRGPHQYRLHYLLTDVPYVWQKETSTLTLSTPAGLYYVKSMMLGAQAEPSVVRADSNGPRGWHSPYYHHREPAVSLALTGSGESAMFVTLFGPETCSVAVDGPVLSLMAPQWTASIRLAKRARQPLIQSVVSSGALDDTLELF